MNIDRTTSVLANMSQILMLFVVIFGYFYTVVPVFQKEKISEELASLQIEKDRWDIEISSYKVEKNKTVKEINELKKIKNELLLSLENKTNEYNLTVKKVDSLKERSKSVEASLRETESELYKELELEILGEKPLPVEFLTLINRSISSSFFDYDNQDNIEGIINDSYLKPNEIAKEKLTALNKVSASSKSKSASRAAKKLAQEFEKGLDKNAHLLQCNRANPTAWKSAFVGAKSIGDEMLETCADMHFDKRIQKEGWDEKEVQERKKDKSWGEQRASYKHYCIIHVNYKIESYFNEKWSYANKPCEDRVMKLSKIVLGKISESDLMALRDMSPPNQIEIKGAINEAIRNWYGDE